MIPNRIFFIKLFAYSDLRYIFAVRKGGAIAQSVEQWTENPCVPGSIPGGTTSLNSKPRKINDLWGFVLFADPVLRTFQFAESEQSQTSS
jgi:hypothetical protein